MLRLVRLIGLGLLSALTVSMLSLPAAALEAEEEEPEEIDYQRTGVYVGANVAFGDSHFKDKGNFGTAWGFNIRAGYRAMEYFAIELEYERFSHFLARSSPVRVEYAVNSVTVNTKVPFFSGPLQPYLLYGLGAQIVSNETTNNTDSDFSMRMGGGLDIYFSDHFILNTAVNYNRGFGDVRDFRYMSVSSGITYRFSSLEFFFDCSSPWTYLAFHEVEAMAQEAGAQLVWRPILVGGIFNSINPSVYEQRGNPIPSKFRYYAKDLVDWARLRGLSIGTPPVFPVNSVKAMRGCFVALEQGKLPEFARAVFESYWGNLEDISQDEVLEKSVLRAGLDPVAFFAAIATPEVKAKLRANTDELIERGGFGSPTLFVNGDDMYFGNDRMDLVRRALAGE